MFKFDQVKNLFNCDLCNKLLVEPVIIPCGNTVCKSHLEELFYSDNFLIINSENFIKCVCCDKKHYVPEDGFTVSKRFQSALDMELIKLKLTTEFYECKEKIKDTLEQATEIEIISGDSSVYINSYFDEIKNHVNSRREDLKYEIDKYADKLIQSIDYNQFTCIELSKENIQLAKTYEDSKRQLDELIKHFDTFEIEDLNFKHIKTCADDLNERFRQMLAEYKDSLILHQDCVLVCDDDRSISLIVQDAFGSVLNKKKVNTNYWFILSVSFTLLSFKHSCVGKLLFSVLD